MDYKCRNPYELKSGLIVRCGGCASCRIIKSMNWVSRMKLEQIGATSWPFFLTLTYAERRTAIDECVANFQRFIKRWRKKADIRYFQVLEVGGKNGRLHHHAIVWSKELSRRSVVEQMGS